MMTLLARLLTPRLLLTAALVAGMAGGAMAATSVTQFGITWTFDRDYPTGQFANGDYWVVGPVTLTAISPRATVSNGVTMHGSMINPAPNRSQGYDSRMQKHSYDATVNAGLRLPLTVAAGSSVVSAESYTTTASGDNPQIKTFAILTVLDRAPAPGSFRPAPIGTDKTIRWNKSQLDYSVLRTLPVPANAPALATVAARFERPWMEQTTNWTGRYMHAGGNQPTYGREIAHALAEGLLTLQLAYSNAEKEALLIRLVQYGIDVHGTARAGAVWANDGGHNPGRKMPLLLAGATLRDPSLLEVGDAQKFFIFQEDQQTWYVTQYDVGRTLYSADGRTREEYIQSDVGIPEWGEKHSTMPERDGRNWGISYRNVAGSCSIGHLLTARLMGLEKQWNWPAAFDYYDRYFRIQNPLNVTGPNGIQPFVQAMWTAYRTSTPAPFTLETTAVNTWGSTAIPAQTGTVTVAYDLMASQANMDGVTGLSFGAADAFTDLATIVRLAPTGFIDVRNGATYAAATTLAYTPGVTYRVVMTVDIPNRRYSVTVTPAGGSPITLATNYAFRTEQAGATTLDRLSFFADTGAHAVTNVGVQVVPPPPTTTTTTTSTTLSSTLNATKTWASAAVPVQRGLFEIAFDATPSVTGMDGVTGVSFGVPTGFPSLAAAVRFAPNGKIDVRNGGNFSAATSVTYKAGVRYRFVLTVDVPNRRYSVKVTPAGGATVTLATNYAFRTEQAGVTALDRIGACAAKGAHTVSAITVTPK